MSDFARGLCWGVPIGFVGAFVFCVVAIKLAELWAFRRFWGP